MAHATTVRRIDFGHFLRPASETRSGHVRAEPVLGYLVEHRDGLLLFDTGMGGNPEIDAHYRPARTPLRSAVPDLDGAAEILPGVTLLPTPGHTSGHQSLVVRLSDGTVVLAGQSHDTASDFAADALASRHRVLDVSAWMEQILALDPRRVVFAHDHAVWEP